jgi:chemotaxis protein CheC
MILTEQQQDALAELINIAFSRTAASLSDLTSQRVLLDAPRVEICPLSELNTMLPAPTPDDNVATVHQPFAGPLTGDAFLLLSYRDAVTLTNLLTDAHTQSSRLDTSAREVLTEVGNILLNACLGVFGNLLQMHITFAVPRLHFQARQVLLDSIVISEGEERYALVISTSFRLRNSEVSGYLVIVLGVASLDALIQAIERLG